MTKSEALAEARRRYGADAVVNKIRPPNGKWQCRVGRYDGEYFQCWERGSTWANVFANADARLLSQALEQGGALFDKTFGLRWRKRAALVLHSHNPHARAPFAWRESGPDGGGRSVPVAPESRRER